MKLIETIYYVFTSKILKKSHEKYASFENGRLLKKYATGE